MIDVNDLAEVILPVRSAIGAIAARLAGWRLAACQLGCNRCEEITPVKAGGEVLWPPVDVPAARLYGTALDQLE